ncbi:alpha/beta hydrolase, partial [Streptomyces pseudovenezuelae]
MPVLPGAEPFRHEGGEAGVLLCHGFTGSPQSLRPWAQHLAEHGLTVSLPLLPGHGTRWQDMALTGWQDWYAEVDRELRALTERCTSVFVAGLSMGGTLALRLAAKHGDAVRGVVVVNPANRMHGLAPYA